LNRGLRFGFTFSFLDVCVSSIIVAHSFSQQLDAAAVVQTLRPEKSIHGLPRRDNPCLAGRPNLEKELVFDKTLLSCRLNIGKFILYVNYF
jgi:hypothetical protein